MKQTGWKGLVLGGLLMSMAVSGCQVVHVSDPQGKSIEGVTVKIDFAKMGDVRITPLSEITNSRGNVTFTKPMAWDHPLWMTISKFGYLPRGVDYPTGGYVHIVLTPIGSDGSEP